MTQIIKLLYPQIVQSISDCYQISIEDVQLQATRKDFEGDITLMVFPLLKRIKQSPELIGETLGNNLIDCCSEVTNYNVVKGFLNLTISDKFYLSRLQDILSSEDQLPYQKPITKREMMIEYSSPNTNKPLHLGHIRNILLGYSVSQILKVTGHRVHNTQIVNDRGIHICKSMLAWQKFGEGKTPETSKLKGDKFVGQYYVLFDKYYKQEMNDLIAKGLTLKQAKVQAPILLEAQQMLKEWERGEPVVRELWRQMNGWVYKGFDSTYASLGVDFDKLYYESDTYLLGKNIIDEGLKNGIFYRKDDGSVWVDLSDEGLDEKLLLRADGTSVYMTQDIGTAVQRVRDFPDVLGMVYTVGNEQDYHFKVLFHILKKMGYLWANDLHHLSYGMVDLPYGKMKSREGIVVDADDLIEQMTTAAAETSEQLGDRLQDYSQEQRQELYQTIGTAALKYYILKVDPKKRILFDPKESIDFNGNTGPFIQYAYARICSLLRQIDTSLKTAKIDLSLVLDSKEKSIIKQLDLLEQVLLEAADELSPAIIANYTYDLVKEFNSFYQNISVLKASSEPVKIMRTQLCLVVGETIYFCFSLLGITVPNRM